MCCPFNLPVSHLTPPVLDCRLLLVGNFAQFSPVMVSFSSKSKSEQSLCLQYNLLTCRNKARVTAPAAKPSGGSTSTPLAGLYSSSCQCPLTFRCSCGCCREWFQSSTAQPPVAAHLSALTHSQFAVPFPAVGYCHQSCGWMHFPRQAVQKKKKCLGHLITARGADNSECKA